MIKRILVSIASLLALLVPTLAPVTVAAQDIEGGLKCGAELQFGSTDCELEGAPEDEVNNIITTIINILSLVVGVVAVIMIIIGGFRYVLSGGNDSSVAGAKNSILFAVVGLVIVALAQIIVRFVLDQVTND